MHVDTTMRPRPLARPMGDDWLTRDPESFGDDTSAAEDAVPSAVGATRWQRLRADFMLYLAGITTGLAVVVAVLLLVTLMEKPMGVVTPPLEPVATPGAAGSLVSTR